MLGMLGMLKIFVRAHRPLPWSLATMIAEESRAQEGVLRARMSVVINFE